MPIEHRHRPEAIAFIGDIHGDLYAFAHTLATVLNRGVTTIIQVGDFWAGYTDPVAMNRMQLLAARAFDNADLDLTDLDYRFIDGNHENFNILDPDTDQPVSYTPWLTYMPRGSVATVNGRTIGFLGGASSVDKKWRVEGESWWPEENLNEEEADRLAQQVDILVTHETGSSRFHELLSTNRHSRTKFNDPAGDRNRELIDEVLHRTRPGVHIHGHHHHFKEPSADDTSPAGNTISLSLETDFGSIAIVDGDQWSIPWGRNDCGEDIILDIL